LNDDVLTHGTSALTRKSGMLPPTVQFDP
jgi:hypothetical protein